MAVRNTLLGGTDFHNERVKSYDINDTFNELYNKVRAFIV